MFSSSRCRSIQCCIHFISVIIVVTVFVAFAPVVHAQAKKDLVDLNSASEKELTELKGVGTATAKKIIAGRPYKSVDELSKAGLSSKKIDEVKPFVTVGGAAPGTVTPQPPIQKAAPAAPGPPKESAQTPATPKPPGTPPTKAAAGARAAPAAKLAPGEKVNINTAAKEKLEALPGIGPAKAQAIIDGRPYSKPEDILKVKGIKEGTYKKIKDLIIVQ